MDYILDTTPLAYSESPANGRDSAPEAGAPEVEVTSAMIEAGMEEYLAVWPSLRDAEDGAAELMLMSAY